MRRTTFLFITMLVSIALDWPVHAAEGEQHVLAGPHGPPVEAQSEHVPVSDEDHPADPAHDGTDATEQPDQQGVPDHTDHDEEEIESFVIPPQEIDVALDAPSTTEFITFTDPVAPFAVQALVFAPEPVIEDPVFDDVQGFVIDPSLNSSTISVSFDKVGVTKSSQEYIAFEMTLPDPEAFRRATVIMNYSINPFGSTNGSSPDTNPIRAQFLAQRTEEGELIFEQNTEWGSGQLALVADRSSIWETEDAVVARIVFQVQAPAIVDDLAPYSVASVYAVYDGERTTDGYVHFSEQLQVVDDIDYTDLGVYMTSSTTSSRYLADEQAWEVIVDVPYGTAVRTARIRMNDPLHGATLPTHIPMSIVEAVYQELDESYLFQIASGYENQLLTVDTDASSAELLEDGTTMRFTFALGVQAETQADVFLAENEPAQTISMELVFANGNSSGVLPLLETLELVNPVSVSADAESYIADCRQEYPFSVHVPVAHSSTTISIIFDDDPDHPWVITPDTTTVSSEFFNAYGNIGDAVIVRTEGNIEIQTEAQWCPVDAPHTIDGEVFIQYQDGIEERTAGALPFTDPVQFQAPTISSTSLDVNLRTVEVGDRLVATTSFAYVGSEEGLVPSTAHDAVAQVQLRTSGDVVIATFVAEMDEQEFINTMGRYYLDLTDEHIEAGEEYLVYLDLEGTEHDSVVRIVAEEQQEQISEQPVQPIAANPSSGGGVCISCLSGGSVADTGAKVTLPRTKATTKTGVVGETFSFEGTPHATTSTRIWKISDGRIIDQSTREVLSLTFAQAGTYTVVEEFLDSDRPSAVYTVTVLPAVEVPQNTSNRIDMDTVEGIQQVRMQAIRGNWVRAFRSLRNHSGMRTRTRPLRMRTVEHSSGAEITFADSTQKIEETTQTFVLPQQQKQANITLASAEFILPEGHVVDERDVEPSIVDDPGIVLADGRRFADMALYQDLPDVPTMDWWRVFFGTMMLGVSFGLLFFAGKMSASG